MVDIENLYRMYFNDVYKYIRKLCGHEYIAEEITTDTFFKAMKAVDGFRGDCDIRIWLCQIAKNSYLSYMKKAGRTENISDKEFLSIADPKNNIEKQIVDYEQALQIKKILHELPEPYKEVFMWRVFGDLSFKQIGEIFHKTENWACVTYHRARLKIKERMEAIDYEK